MSNIILSQNVVTHSAPSPSQLSSNQTTVSQQSSTGSQSQQQQGHLLIHHSIPSASLGSLSPNQILQNASTTTTMSNYNPSFKDTRWLTLEVCREFQRGKCNRTDTECKFAHPPTYVEINNGKVIACYDSLKVS
jgi:hypothetical protein